MGPAAEIPMAESRPSPNPAGRSGLTRSTAFVLAAAACFGVSCFLVGLVVGRHGTPLAAQGAARSTLLMDSLAQPLAKTGSLTPDPLESFMEVYEHLKSKFYQPIGEADKRKLAFGAVRGMLRELGDPYTRFMEPKDYDDFKQDTEGKLKGIGAVLGIDRKTVRILVTRVFPNNPAAKAGLKAGDLIIRVNDEPTDDMSLDLAVSKIRGEANTKVKLTVLRPEAAKPADPEVLRKFGISPDDPRRDPSPVDPNKLKDIVITRGEVDIPIVESEMLGKDKDIGYVHLMMFNEESFKQLSGAVAELKGKNMRALVLDLRDNPGGMLEEAVKIVSYFVKETPEQQAVVYVQERDKAPETLPLNGKLYGALGCPMVVLVNGFSASASEILSGALKDYKQAVLIGEKTFGKGLVQTVVPLSDRSALVVTTAVYLTPNKININKKGIEPDIKVPWSLEEQETALQAGLAAGKSREQWDVQLKAGIEELRRQLAAKPAAKN
jgi:carboxyl-terminal processing protease